jgi:hypothetical protein
MSHMTQSPVLLAAMLRLPRTGLNPWKARCCARSPDLRYYGTLKPPEASPKQTTTLPHQTLAKAPKPKIMPSVADVPVSSSLPPSPKPSLSRAPPILPPSGNSFLDWNPWSAHFQGSFYAKVLIQSFFFAVGIVAVTNVVDQYLFVRLFPLRMLHNISHHFIPFYSVAQGRNGRPLR